MQLMNTSVVMLLWYPSGSRCVTCYGLYILVFLSSRMLKYKIESLQAATVWLTDQLLCYPPPPQSLLLLQLHNEDDTSEASTSEQQPCTSAAAQASASSWDPSQAQASTAPAAVAAEGASGPWSQGEGEVPPPPYASIVLGATAAAPGVWKKNVI